MPLERLVSPRGRGGPRTPALEGSRAPAKPAAGSADRENEAQRLGSQSSSLC